MSAITISREFGSEGDYIAERVAQTLGYHLVDKEFIGAVLSQYGVVEFGREYETLPSFWERLSTQRDQRRDVMVDMLNQVVRAVAQHGNVVILGRSGFAILAGLADVLHVRLQAPLSLRIERVMAQQKIAREQAEAVVKEKDRVRAAFVEGFYGVPWEAVHAFDLVINTDKISPDLAMTWVVAAAKAFVTGPETAKLTTRSIKVDPILAAAVSDGLRCEMVHE
jgi:cytidylate kinase